MREPKFRVWSKIDRQMLSVDSIMFKEHFVNVHLKQHFWVSRAFYEIEFMESTGLHDIHGKEVYEGDIIKDSEDFIAQVVYDKEYAGFGLNYQPFDLVDGLNVTFEELKNEYRNTFEVIGNIYENQELLGEEE